MGAGNQSLVPWALSQYGSQSASAYKCTVDANEAIRSQPCAALCVYPTNPPTLSAVVDTGFVLFEPGSGFLLQESGAPTQVTLAAPSANSWYATIYYDQELNTCGAIYGAAAASPVPSMPDYLHQIPLAIVLIAAGQVSVQAANIIDIRQWVGTRTIIQLNDASSSTTNCYGLTSANFTLGGSFSLVIWNLENLSYGTDLSLLITPGITMAIYLNATTPDGNTIATYWADRDGGSNSKVLWNASNSVTFNLGSGNFYPLDGFWVEQPGSGTPYLLFA